MSGTNSTPGATAVTEPVSSAADPDGILPDPPTRTNTAVVPDGMSAPARKVGRRVRGRKVRSILKHVSPWSVFKVALVFSACFYGVSLLAGVMVWRLAENAGVIDNAETFIAKGFAMESFAIDGEAVFRAAALAGLIIAAAMAGLAMLSTVFFNIICDITGGIRFSTVELEPRKAGARKAGRVEAAKPPPAPLPVAVDADGRTEPVTTDEADDEDVIDLTDEPSVAGTHPVEADTDADRDLDEELAAEPAVASTDADGSSDDPSVGEVFVPATAADEADPPAEVSDADADDVVIDLTADELAADDGPTPAVEASTATADGARDAEGPDDPATVKASGASVAAR